MKSIHSQKTRTAPKAVIFGVSSTHLTPQEKKLFKALDPLGFILFTRNCVSTAQVRSLVAELNSCLSKRFDQQGNPQSPPILIDQEGGRINRLLPPSWDVTPAARHFGKLAEKDLALALPALREAVELTSRQLLDVGVTVNCAPVVDLFHEESSEVIGDRALSPYPDIVAPLAIEWANHLSQRGIIPVIKHLPGHGRALVDSHKELPILGTHLEDLKTHDFLVFQRVCEQISPSFWGMTAHILYESVDATQPATFSAKVISEIIREFIGFRGFLISDCLTMEALSGSYAERACRALEAGCDAVLHCNGHLEEMKEIASVIPSLSEAALERLG